MRPGWTHADAVSPPAVLIAGGTAIIARALGIADANRSVRSLESVPAAAA